jgi:TRAP-type C4-dicarboxylate transport system permease small subunit
MTWPPRTYDPQERGVRSATTLRFVFRAVQKVEEWILASSILVIVIVSVANVFCRTVLNSSLTFAEELAQFCMITVTFIGLGYAASKGRHIRMSALHDQLGQRARKGLMIAITAATSALLFLLTYYSIRYVATVAHLGTVSPALRVPLYIVYCTAPLGLALAGIQYALAVVRNCTDSDVFLSYDTRDEYEDVPPPAV